jgi:hypothetical protein
LWDTLVSRQTSASPYCGKKVDVVTRGDVVLEGSSPKTITCRVLDNVYQYWPSGTATIPTVTVCPLSWTSWSVTAVRGQPLFFNMASTAFVCLEIFSNGADIVGSNKENMS